MKGLRWEENEGDCKESIKSNMREEYSIGKRGVVAITSASHAEGRGFNPLRLYFFFFFSFGSLIKPFGVLLMFLSGP